MHNLSLLRATRKVMTRLDEQVRANQLAAIEDVLPFINTVQRMFPQWVIQTCVQRHPETRFISENCKDYFGYTAEYLLKQHYPLMLFSHIHEEDVDDLQQCFAYIERLLQERNFEDPAELRFVFHYRIRHKNGNYLYLYDEKASLQVNDTLTLHYSLFRDISMENLFSGVKLEIYVQGDTLHKIATYKPATDQLKLSRREDDILQLIRQGLTNKQIAGELKISPNTARNIRQKIFKRYRVNNTIELINKAIYYN